MVMTGVVSGQRAEPVTEPESEVAERATRRTYIAQYKLRILAEYERRDRDGKGALLRREGLYTSLIWLQLVWHLLQPENYGRDDGAGANSGELVSDSVSVL